MTPTERMAAIFVGNAAGHYTADLRNARRNEKGKVVPDNYLAQPGPPSVQEVDDHLSGKRGLLVVPVDQAGMCTWGKIDVDDYTLDGKTLAKRIAKQRLPLILERSKSGGWHLAWYLRMAMLASVVRKQLADFAARLGFSNVEIFPKQDALEPGDFGNGINLPYFGGGAAENYAVDDEGNKLTVAAWLDRIEQMRDAPLPHASSVNVELAGKILAEHWTHDRNELCLIALGTMLRAKVDEQDAQEIVDYAMELAGDEEQGTGQRPAVVRVARDLAADKKVPGQRKLRERIGDEATDAFLQAIGKSSKDQLPLTFELLPCDFLDTQPSPVTFTVAPLLPRGVVALLIAEGAAGKTTFAVRLAMCVAAGRRLFGMDINAGRAVYVALEDNREALWRRVYWVYQREVLRMQSEKASLEAIEAMRQSLLTRLSVESAVGFELHLVKMYQGQAIQSPLIDTLIRLLPRPLELLVLDPMSRLNGAEENSNAVGTAMINASERIAREVGCTVLIAHHTGKAAAKGRDEGPYAARGASGFADAARSVVRLMVANSEDVKGFSNVDEGAVARDEIVKIIHAKCNDAPKAPDLWLRRQGHDFDLWAPQSAQGGVNRYLAALFNWWVNSGRKPFTKSAVEDMREAVFGARVSRERARAVVAEGVHLGVIAPSDEGSTKSQHPPLTFRRDYDPDAL